MPTLPSRILCVALLSALSLIGSTFVGAGISQADASDAAPASTAPAIVVPLSASSASTAFEKEVLALVNKARSAKRKCGSKTYAKAKALKWNGKLALAAELHSSDMSTRNYFSHTGANGKSAGARIKAAGYKYKAMGETLAAGHATPKAVVNAWLKSTAHCKILMSKSYTQLGVGYSTGQGKYIHYTTANFGKPK